MWVEESLRNRRLARALIAGAETEARRRGCTLVIFHAYDLLARGLYDRLGYETVGVINVIPPRPLVTHSAAAGMTRALSK